MVKNTKSQQCRYPETGSEVRDPEKKSILDYIIRESFPEKLDFSGIKGDPSHIKLKVIQHVLEHWKILKAQGKAPLT